MNKKYNTLNKNWKEILYGMSGFGPNLLMVLMGAYFTDAINPAALPLGSLQASSRVVGGISLILPMIFPILWMLGKLFDGLIDLPLASLTDNLKTKCGRRRLPIAICFIPMVVAYAFCWIPIDASNQLANTIWIIVSAFIFFATYTMCLIAYYGSLSTVCISEKQRTRVSSYKAFFDTISYCLVYALVPLLIQVLNIHIDQFALLLLPTMITMIIPLFMIKEGEKFEQKAIKEGYDITPLAEEEKVGIVESIKAAFTNKPFIRWALVNCCAFFGLQIFLVSMNALILTGMGLTSAHMAILNTCAFAPVPVMLYLFNKMKSKKGFRFTLQTCLLSFSVCIFSFFLGSEFVLGSGNDVLKIIIGCVGGLFGSWGISAFFMSPYLVSAQVAAVEEKVNGRNISAMFFATNAVLSSITGAVAGGMVYENIKMLFISKDTTGIVWAENFAEAATKFGVDIASVYNLGVILVPFIVSAFCALGFVLAFTMPKKYTHNEIIKYMNVDMSKVTLEPEEPASKESVGVNLAIYVLSGTIFGHIWRYGLINKYNPYKNKKMMNIHFILTVLVPFYNGVVLYKISKQINKELDAKNIKHKDMSVLSLIFGSVFLDVVSYALLENQSNLLIEDRHE